MPHLSKQTFDIIIAKPTNNTTKAQLSDKTSMNNLSVFLSSTNNSENINWKVSSLTGVSFIAVVAILSVILFLLRKRFARKETDGKIK